MPTRIVSVDFNPYLRLLWIGRLPRALPRNYCAGIYYRQYRQTGRRSNKLFDACVAAGLRWSQDENGTHFRAQGIA